MAEHIISLPEMGEGVMEATIIKWNVKEGDLIDIDEELIEIATDKVDSEVSSTHKGKISKLLVKEGDVVKIGHPIVIIENDENLNNQENNQILQSIDSSNLLVDELLLKPTITADELTLIEEDNLEVQKINKDLFLSPLVKSIIFKESISTKELDNINPTGLNNRITKVDILDYLENRNPNFSDNTLKDTPLNNIIIEDLDKNKFSGINRNYISTNSSDEIIEIDRMRKLISNHMISSKNTAVHVTSFVEADVTKIVNWRNKYKDFYKNREGETLTYTPIFIEAIVKSLLLFPMLNISFDGERIIKKKNINIGIATALPNGNLIVPVVKNADKLSLLELSKEINSLIFKARNNKLQPKDITEGTYTVSNIGTFGNIIGTPIINQPQVAIMALGSIKKKPSVIETKEGDYIGIKSKMFLSHSYDHRIIDGFLGGSFAQKVAQFIEEFDIERSI